MQANSMSTTHHKDAYAHWNKQNRIMLDHPEVPHNAAPPLLSPSCVSLAWWTWWASGMNDCQNKKDPSSGMVQRCSKRAYWIQGCQRVRPEPHAPSDRSESLHASRCWTAWSWSWEPKPIQLSPERGSPSSRTWWATGMHFWAVVDVDQRLWQREDWLENPEFTNWTSRSSR